MPIAPLPSQPWQPKLSLDIATYSLGARVWRVWAVRGLFLRFVFSERCLDLCLRMGSLWSVSGSLPQCLKALSFLGCCVRNEWPHHVPKSRHEVFVAPPPSLAISERQWEVGVTWLVVNSFTWIHSKPSFLVWIMKYRWSDSFRTCLALCSGGHRVSFDMLCGDRIIGRYLLCLLTSAPEWRPLSLRMDIAHMDVGVHLPSGLVHT